MLDGTRASRGSLGQDFAQPGSSCGAESDEAARTFSGKSQAVDLMNGKQSGSALVMGRTIGLGESDRIGSQEGGLPTGATGCGIFRKIPPVDLWATLRA